MCFVHGQGQKIEQQLTTKNFVESHNHFFFNYEQNGKVIKQSTDDI